MRLTPMFIVSERILEIVMESKELNIREISKIYRKKNIRVKNVEFGVKDLAMVLSNASRRQHCSRG